MLIRLIHPDNRDAAMGDIVKKYPGIITVDYTHPSAVNANAVFYARHHLPFVMGTTGGDRKALENTVAGFFDCRGHCTQHGQTDRRASGHAGIWCGQFSGPV